MPTPNPDKETRSEWLNRCIPVVIDDGTAKNSKQAVAVCVSMWRDELKKRRQNG